MIKAAIEKIIEIADPKILTDLVRTYSTKPIHPVLDPLPFTIKLQTLTGLVDYLESNFDKLHNKGTTPEIMIHIEDHSYVQLYGYLTEMFQQRRKYISCIFDEPVFQFGHWQDIETFIINLQAMFIQDETTAAILKLVGNLKHSAVRTHADDGHTQQVTASTGVTKVEDVDAPNPVTLQPRRTFVEIEQPQSLFVFRLRAGKGEALPTCALFEADGGGWKLEAIHRIRAWLHDKLPDIPIIA